MTQALVGALTAGIVQLARLPLQSLIGDRAPFTFVSFGVVVASLLAGWPAGLIALALGQLLTWYLVFSPASTSSVADGQQLGAIAVASILQILMLTVLSLYQRAVTSGVTEREQRLRLLDNALDEIDHRTRNNYATVLAMVELQARSATEESVAEALRQVSDRIQAIADASNRLARHSEGLDTIRLDDHLCGLVHQIERGLAHDGIVFECDVDEVTANSGAATSISIIVNELVTNAIKHAFNGRDQGLVQISGRQGREFELIVADNGRGIKATRVNGSSGLGTRLVDSFARQLKATHEIVSSEVGTVHRLLIPSLD